VNFTEGFLGVIIGSVIGGILSIIAQYIFSRNQERRESRKILAKNINEILTYIESVDKAIYSIINLTKVEITDGEDDGILNVIKDMQKFTNECVSYWDSYKKIIYTYFPRMINKKEIKEFEKIVTEIKYITYGLKTLNFTGIMPEVLRNQQEDLRNKEKCYLEAKEINKKIKEKYLKYLWK